MHQESRVALNNAISEMSNLGALYDDLKIAFNAGMLEAARLCEIRVKRPPGYNGQWEGYGSSVTKMEGDECAALIKLRVNGR